METSMSTHSLLLDLANSHAARELGRAFNTYQHGNGMAVSSGLATFGLGVLIGAGLGLLFAPRPGHELREKLGEQVAGMRETMETGSRPQH
jgi:hypothetical protein